MVDLPKVSVITPTYNRADLLPRAVQSVLSQDFTDLELMIVDDGSTDNTEEVVRELQAQDDRVCYWKLPENRGIGFARDFGLRRARGEYVAWIDSDDVWLPGKLVEQVRVLDKYPEIDFLFTDFANINEIDQTATNGFGPVKVAMRMLEIRQLEDDVWFVVSGMERSLLRKMIIQLGTVVFRSEITKRIGSFDPTLSGPEDFEFCWRAAVMDCNFAYMTTLTQQRYVNRDSITAEKVGSIHNTLKVLRVCQQTARALERDDLLGPIQDAQLRYWRNLMWVYGRDGLRDKATSTFRKSLQIGFSPYNLLFWFIAMVGPKTISLVQTGLHLRKGSET